MTKKIAVINYKGGTGKTTTTAHIAYALSMKGYKTLLIDTDSQGSLAAFFDVKPKKTLYHVLTKSGTVASCVQKAKPNLDIICSDETTFPAELKLYKTNDRELVLSKQLERIATKYDYVIVDCAPVMNLINQNVLLFVDELILPITLEYLSLQGVKQLLKNLKIINKLFKKRLKILKVIPTIVSEEKDHSDEVLKSLERVFPGKISSPIRYCPCISKASGFRKTVFDYAPDSNGAKDYNKIVEDILSHA